MTSLSSLKMFKSQRSLEMRLLFAALSAALVIHTDGIETELKGPPIKDLLNITNGNKIQVVDLKDYGSQNSVLLTYPEENVHRQDPELNEIRGEFIVQAPVNHGLMVVIQYLHLRTQFRGLSRDDVQPYCRDYVQISEPYGNETSQICGLAAMRDPSLAPGGLIGPRTFYAPRGKVLVKVYIDGNNATDLARYLHDEFQMSFTATKDCNESDQESVSSDLYASEAYKPCFDAKSTNDTIPRGLCIASSLFCDNVKQCGYHGKFSMIVGSEEMSCGAKLTEIGIMTPSRSPGSLLWIIAVVIVLALIVMVVGFITSSVITLPCMKNDGFEAANASSSTTHITKNVERNGAPSSHQMGSGSSYSSFTMEEPV